MTSILHISDLHFGRTQTQLVEAILKEIHERAPDLVVVSGDFTQSALHDEFRAARQFLRRIAQPVFAVPGNHDVPRFNPLERFTHPFARYRAYIGEDTDPRLDLGDCALVGINTSRPVVPHWNWANGMVSRRQLRLAEQSFAAAPPGKCRVLVCHHPLQAVSDAPLDTIVWRSRDMLSLLARQHVDLVLSGHIHHASITRTGADHAMIFLGAGTATSTRLRRQTNGYNFITVANDTIRIDLYDRYEDRYRCFETQEIARRPADKT